MSKAAKFVRKAIRLMIKVVDTAILIVIMFLIAADYYAVWDSRQAYEWAEAANYEIYKPDTEAQGYSFDELQAINPEVFAWLTIYGTHIDYPVVHAADNLKYINTNAMGQYSLSGAIFLDARCDSDFSDFPSIMYGHHMEKNTMFGDIGNFAGKEYFDAHKYGMLYYNGQEYGLEFFALLNCDAYDTTVFKPRIEGQEAREAYIDLLLRTATYTRGIEIAADERIVLLSTCSPGSTNGRDILVGRITDTLYEDSFGASGSDTSRRVDELPDILAQLPLWVKVLVAILLILMLLLLSLAIRLKHPPGKRDKKPHTKGDRRI